MTTKTTPKKAGSLTFPTDPLAAMQELSNLDAQPAGTDLRESVSTEARTDGLTEGREEARKPVSEYASTEASPHVSTEASAEARQDVRKPARAPVLPSARRPAREEGQEGADPGVTEVGLVAFVEGRLASREPLVGGVKATVDMSPELSSRAKRYLADHRGQSTRQILIELFDAFLTVKGY